MKQIPCFKTKDGKVFEDKGRAKEHDSYLKLRGLKRKFCIMAEDTFKHYIKGNGNKKTASVEEYRDYEKSVRALMENIYSTLGTARYDNVEEFAEAFFDLLFDHGEEITIMVRDFNLLKART